VTQAFPTLLLRQRVLLVGGLLGIAAISWGYLFRMEREMGPVCSHCLTATGRSMGGPWILGMWVVMMIAMMVPTAAQTSLFFARFVRGKDASAALAPPLALFVAGYVAAWTIFSALATALQLGLERAALMSPMGMKLLDPAAGGVVLIVAGVFQFTPWKTACLRSCRSPLGFFMTSWREGRLGPLWMGLHHGLFCLGCCWALMLVLFSLGTMNMLWIALLTGLVLVEKIAPRGDLVARVAGVAMAVGGLLLCINR
jgi:predicted metal-binding membrane protein